MLTLIDELEFRQKTKDDKQKNILKVNLETQTEVSYFGREAKAKIFQKEVKKVYQRDAIDFKFDWEARLETEEACIRH